MNTALTATRIASNAMSRAACIDAPGPDPRDAQPRTGEDTDELLADLAATLDRRTGRERRLFFSLMRLVSGHDNETAAHCLRVGFLARAIGRSIGLASATTDDLLLATPFHDVGKAVMITECDHKPGPLSREEKDSMRGHAAAGRRLLAGRAAPLLRVAAEIAGAHHERWDGTGYPDGLSGDAIPLSGRIAAVADVFDALVSERPYKRAWRFERAVDYIIGGAGEHFDPSCVRAFCERQDEVTHIIRVLGWADEAVNQFVTANLAEQESA